jgi:hypothetical protein
MLTVTRRPANAGQATHLRRVDRNSFQPDDAQLTTGCFEFGCVQVG